MRVLFFGTYDARRHPRIAVLREGFEAAGDDVLECNVPLDLDTTARVQLLRQPWRAPVFGTKLLVAWRRLRSMAARLPVPDVIVVGYLGHWDVRLTRRLWPDRLIVLDHLVSLADTARDRRSTNRAVLRALEGVDRRALAAANIALVDTEEHRQMLDPGPRRRAIVVPVGAPGEWFHPPISSPDPLRVVFFGTYTPLQGAPVIGEAIGKLVGADVRFTMIGHGQDLDETRRAAASADVHWHRWVEPERLPELVAEHDVCLGIFGTGDKAARVVPNKVFQGAAAGCAIVTSDTAPQRRALTEGAVFVPAGDAEALASALEALASDPAHVRELRRSAHALAERQFRPEAVVSLFRERLRVPA